MNVALIGNGYWGQIYIKTLKNIENVNLFVYTHNYKEALKNNTIDCAIIATPLETHFQIAKDCLLAGKHILIEKPFVSNLHEARELQKLVEEKNLVVLIGHLYLYHDGIKKIKKIIDDNILGDIQYVYSHRMSNDSRHSNALCEMGSHDIYILNYFFNKHIDEVISAFGNISHCIFNIQYRKMLSDPDLREQVINACIEVSNYSYQKEKIREMIIEGINQRLIFDDTKSSDLKITCINKEDNSIFNIPINESVTPLEKQCRHFFDCIKNNKKPVVKIHDGFKNIRSLKLIEKILS
jgi:UDP-2-acetamido-3-amino-2,3-dideoxy-glucuronate N-acetyltransferase